MVIPRRSKIIVFVLVVPLSTFLVPQSSNCVQQAFPLKRRTKTNQDSLQPSCHGIYELLNTQTEN